MLNLIGEIEVTPNEFKNNRREPFIPNIPLSWFKEVLNLSTGKAVVVVALAIHRQAKMQNRKSKIRLSANATDSLGICRRSRYRALKTLEEAALIKVTINPGRSTDIDLL